MSSQNQSLIYAFSSQGQERTNQDVGLDGYDDLEEANTSCSCSQEQNEDLELKAILVAMVTCPASLLIRSKPILSSSVQHLGCRWRSID